MLDGFILFWLLPSLITLLGVLSFSRFDGTPPDKLDKEEREITFWLTAIYPIVYIGLFIWLLYEISNKSGLTRFTKFLAELLVKERQLK